MVTNILTKVLAWNRKNRLKWHFSIPSSISVLIASEIEDLTSKAYQLLENSINDLNDVIDEHERYQLYSNMANENVYASIWLFGYFQGWCGIIECGTVPQNTTKYHSLWYRFLKVVPQNSTYTRCFSYFSRLFDQKICRFLFINFLIWKLWCLYSYLTLESVQIKFLVALRNFCSKISLFCTKPDVKRPPKQF